MSASCKRCTVRLTKIMTSTALSAVLLTVSVHLRAQILECIDADGKREFTQKCAPGTVKQREVSKAGASNLDAVTAPPKTSYKEEHLGFRQRQLEREANESKAKTASADAAKKCQSARARLTSMENARRVRGSADSQTGEARYLDDNERAAATQKARDAVSTSCN